MQLPLVSEYSGIAYYLKSAFCLAYGVKKQNGRIMHLKTCILRTVLSLAVLFLLGTLSCAPPEEEKASGLDPGSVEGKWAAKLGDEDYEVRLRAAVNLGRLKEKKAIPALLSALSDEDWHVRRAAVWALIQIGDSSDETIEALSALMRRDSSRMVMEAAAYALSTMDGKAENKFIQALEEPYWYVRYLAAGNLSTVGEYKALEPLARLLNDREYDVRLTAAFALLEIGGEGIELLNCALEGEAPPESLIKRLEFKEPDSLKFFTEGKVEVRMVAAMALGKDSDIYEVDEKNDAD